MNPEPKRSCNWRSAEMTFTIEGVVGCLKSVSPGSADFQRDGLVGLLPEKRGPRQGHKLTAEVLFFAAQLRGRDPSIRPLDLAAAIQERFAITVHPRSIERALARQEKKRR
jgi:hypothetical protein